VKPHQQESRPVGTEQRSVLTLDRSSCTLPFPAPLQAAILRSGPIPTAEADGLASLSPTGTQITDHFPLSSSLYISPHLRLECAVARKGDTFREARSTGKKSMGNPVQALLEPYSGAVPPL